MHEKIERLRSEINRHNYLYHVKDAPIISDSEFDALFRKLQDLEGAYPEYADPNSPTSRVGSPCATNSKREQVKHITPMLSLNNAYSAQEVVSFFRSIPGAVLQMTPKIDGLSLSLTYDRGTLVRAATRGDGSVGEDVTDNARTIRSIPLTVPDNWSGQVRGEVCMPISVFNALNDKLVSEGEDPFANPRNAASGSLKLKNSRIVASRKLAFMAYHVPSYPEWSCDETLSKLNQLGFVVPFSTIGRCSLDRVAGLIEEFDSTRKHLDYAVDGIVFKVNDAKTRESLGVGTRAPKWAVAYKFPPEQVNTVLKSVTLQVGRTGTITPVAELEPVSLSGSTVSRASLCNQDEIDRLGICVGDTVTVVKSAEIIPKVIATVTSPDYQSYADKNSKAGHPVASIHEFNEGYSRVFKIPPGCPCCGSALSKPANKGGEEGVALVCPNASGCRDQIRERLLHAVGKSALDIDGCGKALIEALMGSGVRSLSDLLSVKQGAGVLDFNGMRANGVGRAAALKFHVELKKSLTKPLWRKLHALGIEGLGVNYCKDLESKFASIMDMCMASDEDLSAVIGSVNAKSFVNFITENSEEIEKLDSLGLKFERTTRAGALSGKVFVITGELLAGSRDEVSAAIEKEGGTVKSSVSKKVDYLVVGEGAGATKTSAATKAGVPSITEQDLMSMLGKPLTAGGDFEED